MYTKSTLLAPSGAPFVMAVTNKKLMFMVLMMKKVRVTRITYQVRGRVMMKNWWNFEAPSRLALSYSSSEMESMPAMYMTM